MLTDFWRRCCFKTGRILAVRPTVLIV